VAGWSVVAAVYGLVLAGAALAMPIRRRHVASAICLAYALLAIGAGSLHASFWVQLLAPAGFLLTGYWLSGMFFRDPQGWLETFLLESDGGLFRTFSLDDWLAQSPALILELLEAGYAAVYVAIAAGAVVSATGGIDAVGKYWTIVLASELACYVALPWLRSRPPRSLETPGVMARRAPALRKLNGTILDRGSVHANTLPSGHVAGATAAALAVMPVSASAGLILLVLAVVIAAAAVAGRYHYAVDCVAGASVALLVWSLA
jgi:hypothetical protein